MSRVNRLRAMAGALYTGAIVVSLLAGGFVWVAIIGAVVLSLVYVALAGGGGTGRNRQRNRDRHRG